MYKGYNVSRQRLYKLTMIFVWIPQVYTQTSRFHDLDVFLKDGFMTLMFSVFLEENLTNELVDFLRENRRSKTPVIEL